MRVWVGLWWTASHEGWGWVGGGQQVTRGFWWTANHEGVGGVLVDNKSHKVLGGQQVMRVWVGFWWIASHMRVWADSKT